MFRNDWAEILILDCIFNGSPKSALADFFQVMFKRIWPKNTVGLSEKFPALLS
jgi:hypothetical protein